jgi:molecular chaperone IbpA
MVGFDRLFDLLESGAPMMSGESYPPFDLEQHGDDRFRIKLAVAGFRPNEIEVTAQQNLLIVSGRRIEENEGKYVHRGIAAQTFERHFVLGDYVHVQSADMKDGLLTIDLVRDVPDEMKPRKIALAGASSQARLTDGRATNINKTQKVAA